jgi:hypothetical protein
MHTDFRGVVDGTLDIHGCGVDFFEKCSNALVAYAKYRTLKSVFMKERGRTSK